MQVHLPTSVEEAERWLSPVLNYDRKLARSAAA